EADVAALGPAQLCELLLERANPGFVLAVALGGRHQDCDAPHATWLLRARRERPGHRRSAEERDEVAPLHSITSSPRPSSVGETVRPSVLAVCRLMTSSNLVGACTGSSPGFVPLRIRST